MRYLQTTMSEFKSDVKIDTLVRIYILDILCVSEDYMDVWQTAITTFLQNNEDMIDKWMKIDDNSEYLRIGRESRISFVDNKSDEKVFSDIS